MQTSTLTQHQLGGVIVVAFIIALFIGVAIAPKSADLREQVEVLKSENDGLKERNQDFIRLKATDDLAFQYCGDMVKALNSGVEAAYNRDSKGMVESADQMNKLNEKMSIQMVDRDTILNKLGF